ncbi:DUF1878 family protein [Rossellomorea vietnamensis]|uniref:DUF1878 family protein n=1 Tax=Rossellomorea vietnamensis TaxID=218284 RepID=A0A5D4MET1_9BACI|nr:DUF1878 family protein [Rossellomorea vietnamensis]TYR99525.1 DUF1878 family protein [Rossellomorea vietnamensis]
MNDLLKRIEKIEFQQKLLMEMIPERGYDFYKLIIKKGLSEAQLQEFYQLCERLNIKCQEQKAEGFVFFAPLFKEFTEELNSRLTPQEVIDACTAQKLYPFLMEQLKRNL